MVLFERTSEVLRTWTWHADGPSRSRARGLSGWRRKRGKGCRAAAVGREAAGRRSGEVEEER